MNLSAIYHTATDNFCYPLNEDELVIKIQTGYDVDRVELVYGDPFSCGLFGGGDGWKGDLLEITDVDIDEALVMKKSMQEMEVAVLGAMTGI